MHDNDDLNDDNAPEEDTFWRELIQQWERENPGPAPKRMYEALEQALRRLKRAQHFLTAQKRRPH